MALVIWLAAGSNRQGATANAWAGNGNATTTVDAGDFLGSTSNNFHLTGVQIEKGEATPFEHEQYGTTLAKCQRYYEVCHGSLRQKEFVGYIGCGVQFKQTKRAAPTLTNPVGGNNSGVSFQAYVGGGHGDYLKTAAHPQWTSSTGGHSYGFEITADAEL